MNIHACSPFPQTRPFEYAGNLVIRFDIEAWQWTCGGIRLSPEQAFSMIRNPYDLLDATARWYGYSSMAEYRIVRFGH